MSIKEKMLKVKRLSSGKNTMDSIRDGELPILTNPQELERQVSTEDSDST
jgi:hypothetical protein